MLSEIVFIAMPFPKAQRTKHSGSERQSYLYLSALASNNEMNLEIMAVLFPMLKIKQHMLGAAVVKSAVSAKHASNGCLINEITSVMIDRQHVFINLS